MKKLITPNRMPFTCELPNDNPETVEKYKRLIGESANEMGFSDTDGFSVVHHKDPNTGKQSIRLDAWFYTSSTMRE